MVTTALVLSMFSSAPSVPEPMHFDLVRGLGASAGELEANVLLSVGLDSPRLDVSPELEWAPVDGVALELELPFNEGRLEEVKPSVQVTLPSFHEQLANGLQFTAAVTLHERMWAHALWVIAGQLTPFLSFVASVGPRLDWSTRAGRPAPQLHGLINGALFVPVAGHALGVEVNTAFSNSLHELTVLPQVHLHLTSHLHLQVGVGAVLRETWAATAFARIIVEN